MSYRSLSSCPRSVSSAPMPLWNVCLPSTSKFTRTTSLNALRLGDSSPVWTITVSARTPAMVESMKKSSLPSLRNTRTSSKSS